MSEPVVYVGEIAGPNGAARVKIPLGYFVRFRFANGLAVEVPFGDGEGGTFEITPEGIASKPPPSEAFPIKIFVVEAEQVLFDVILLKKMMPVLTEGWNAVHAARPNASPEDIGPAFKSCLSEQLHLQPSLGPEYDRLMPNAIDFVLDQAIHLLSRKPKTAEAP